MLFEQNAECRTRDGTILRADIYRPQQDGPHPVLLCRTPYDKSHRRYTWMARAFAENGYIAVIQDIRGRDTSDGQWAWHMSDAGQQVEADDGYDSCEWAARLPGADGQVGTWGNSYPSWLIWRMAAADPPSLKAIFTSGFSARTLDCTSGIFETGIRLRWQHGMATSSRRRSGDTSFPQTFTEAEYNWDRLQLGRWLWTLPLADIPDRLYGPEAPMQRRYWEEINREFWALDRSYHAVTVPTMTLTGWWDRLNQCSFHFPGMRAEGPAQTRDQHRLLIGPWVHSVESMGDWVGPRDYGPAARLDLVGEMLRWYDFHLKGRPTGIEREEPVRLFLLNDTGWTKWTDWPPPGMTPTPFFLRGMGHANTPGGDGRLELASPDDEPPDSYVYDPADPVPSLVEAHGQATAGDQRPLASRRDILVYQTAPLTRDLVLAGPVDCTLWITSDAADTDFVVRLIEVGADGLCINISQGIARARYRDGYDREVPLEPGVPTRIAVKLRPVGIRFRRGSRIRVDVTSSDFPAFDRNHNTGRPFHTDRELRVAHQRVLHDASHPSHIVLPVLPE
jgi:putative CocE/NonD family hydrolase